MKNIISNKLFMSLFIADLLSNFGDTLYYLALMNYVLALPNANLGIAAISLSETLPMLFAFPIGLKADKTSDKLPGILWMLVLRIGLYIVIGCLMGFPPSLWIVLVASVINFISDLAGQYENGLFAPLTLRIVTEEDREVAQGFKQTVRSITGVGFQLAGAMLITVMTYQALAFANAATFGVSALIILGLRSKLNQLLQDKPIQVNHQTELAADNPVIELFKNARFAFVELMKISELRATMIVIPVLNAVLSAIEILLLLFMKEYPKMMFGTPASTLVIVSFFLLGGQILGGILSMGVLKKVSIETLILGASWTPVFIFLAFVLQNPYFLMSSFALASTAAGAVSPKMIALLMRHLPEERLATIGAAVDSYFTAGIFLAKLVTSMVITIVKAQQISLVYLCLSILLAGFSLKSRFSSSRDR